MEPIKKNDNLEAFSTVNNLYFSSFYEFSEDNYLKKSLNTTKIESVYFKKHYKKNLFTEKIYKIRNFRFFCHT